MPSFTWSTDWRERKFQNFRANTTQPFIVWERFMLFILNSNVSSLLSTQLSWKTLTYLWCWLEVPMCLRRLIICPSYMLFGIGGIRCVMSDYLVDDIFICVFHCDIQRHKLSLEMSDEVTDCLTSVSLSGWFFQRGLLIGSPLPPLVGYTRNTRNPPSKWLVSMVRCQFPPRLLPQHFYVWIWQHVVGCVKDPKLNHTPW